MPKTKTNKLLFRWKVVLPPVFLVMILGGCSMVMPGKSFKGPLPDLSNTQVALERDLTRHVEKLAGEIGTRWIYLEKNMTATVEYLEAELVGMGYEVERHVFPVGGKDCINLIVELKGSSHPDEIVVVGGHYDTCGPIPGANDNGTGTAATLVLAKHYADKEPARTLRFALFVNEEPPFFRSDEMGSRQYAKRCAEREEDITGMLSLETMGYYSDEKGSQKYPSIMSWFYPGEGNFIGFVGNVSSRKMVRRAVKVFRENAEFPSEGAALPSHVPGVGWSDHESFWLEGFSAVMVTDTAPFRYPHYHESTDTPDKCDFARLARVVEGLVYVVDDLVTPKD